MYKVYSRTYQKTLKLASNYMRFREPDLLTGEQSVTKLPVLIASKGVKKVLIVTDEGITKLRLMEPFLSKLAEEGITYVIYDKTVPNPTIDNIEDARALYVKHACEGLVAFGGGSPIDCAKGIAARLVRPDKQVHQLKGLLKVRKEMPPFFAVPTTAGTGSEATAAAVVSNNKLSEKYAIMDPVLIPHVAVLDPLLTVKLPPHITSTTGMDVLTHAVEAYIGNSNTAQTRAYSKEAVQLIFAHLHTAFVDGENIEARSHMQRAAYVAGMAFTRSYVGYVHAVAHTLGGFYQVPHGLANAVLLPYVLELYGDCVVRPLAELADVVGITSATERGKARSFIEAIRALNAKLDIPTKLEGIQNRDIPVMVDRAHKEAVPLYPVPRFLTKDELFYLYSTLR